MGDVLGVEVKQALAGEMTPKFLATLDAAGRPNCVPIISITPYDGPGEDDAPDLVFGEFFMNKSRQNLLDNSQVGVAVFTAALEAWSLKGTFLGFETTGPYVDWVNQLPLLRYNAYTSARAAGPIRVDEVSEKRGLTKAGVLCNYLRASAMARLLRPSTGNAPCMPRPVEAKFRRASAVRAIAFRDADGFPRALPVMGCVPAGPNRLLVADPLFDAYASAIAPGAEVAVAIITTDPIAYQVKGVYGGRRAGVGVIDLTACYSASPPLLGERLDTR